MVFPVKNPASVNSINPNETPVTPGIIGNETGPATPEWAPAVQSAPQPQQDNGQTPAENSPNTTAPQPGKIVDKSINHKEKITTLDTTDPVTKKADQEENEFIPKVEEVHDAAYHAKHP